MRTIYEVTANGSTVYNGTDEGEANRTRTNWKGRGYTVELLTVEVPDIIEGTAKEAAPAITLPTKKRNETRASKAAARIAAERAAMNNSEMLDHLMNYSRRGGLMQAFIIEAVRRYAEACKAATDETFDSPLLHGAAWRDCAVEVCEALDAREVRS